jgi:thymidylate kinase
MKEIKERGDLDINGELENLKWTAIFYLAVQHDRKLQRDRERGGGRNREWRRDLDMLKRVRKTWKVLERTDLE